MQTPLLCQYRGFKADQRTSMDIYADSMASAALNEGFSLSTVKPESDLEAYSSSSFVMRFLRYWRYPQIAKQVEADLHHVLDHGYAHLHPSLGSGQAVKKTCISVHDLIPMLTFNGHIRDAKGELIERRKPWLNMKSLSYLERYDHIVTISDSTKADLIRYLSIAAEKIEVIPPIINSVFAPLPSADVNEFRDKYEFDQNCKWLMISGNEFYKNHRTCLEVLAELNRQHDVEFRLIKAGFASEEFSREVAELGLESKVQTVFLSDRRELAQLYSFVDCLLFPSLYEGFGMPVAEALGCGTPVVCSDRGALPEAAGPLAAICDAGDVETLSKQVSSMVFDEQRRAKLREQGPEWVHQFRDVSIGAKLGAVYKSMLV